MSNQNGDQPPGRQARPSFQFGIRSLLLLMLMFCVLAMIAGGLIRGRGGASRGMYAVAAIVAPIGLMIFLSIAQAAIRLASHRRNRRQ